MRWWRGEWSLGGLATSDLPLYGSHLLTQADTSVFLVEGEPATDALLRLGIPAIGTVTGASSCPDVGPFDVLKNRAVTQWPDNDEAGAAHMDRAAEALVGVAQSVQVFAPGGLPKGGDAADWVSLRAGKEPAAVVEELEVAVAAAARRVKTTPETQLRPMPLEECLAMQMPQRAWVLDGFLQERDLGMVHAYRGTGKSRFAHAVAVAVASGGSFLKWKAPKPRNVLLVDGELPREQLQEMLAQAVEAADKEPVCDVRLLSSDLLDKTIYSLAIANGRRQIEECLDGVELLILDSISTLCPGAGAENEAESWESMQAWLLALRRRGVTVLLVHHEGKSGKQRGTSKREDVLSQVVQLRRPSDYRAAEGARFEVHNFSKSRASTLEEPGTCRRGRRTFRSVFSDER